MSENLGGCAKKRVKGRSSVMKTDGEMNVIDLISEKECEFVNYVENYCGQPVLLYGAGIGSQRVYRYMKKKGVTVEALVVDKEYLQEAVKVDSYPIQSIDDIFRYNPNKQYDIIVCIDKYNAERLKTYGRQIHDVLYYDIFYGLDQEDEISYIPYLYYRDHAKDLNWVYEQLSDTYSRQLFVAYINQRISCDFKWANGFVESAAQQYFAPDLVQLHSNDVFIDCGSFDGASTVEFLRHVPTGGAYVFEPDKKNLPKLKANLQLYRSDKIKIFPNAIADKNYTQFFQGGKACSSRIDEHGDSKVECIALDTMLQEEKVSMIKMDIEGYELSGLHGARKVIENQHPILAICLYHKPEDIFSIPLFIHDIYPAYRFYLRRYSKGCAEIVLYAIP